MPQQKYMGESLINGFRQDYNNNIMGVAWAQLRQSER